MTECRLAPESISLSRSSRERLAVYAGGEAFLPSAAETRGLRANQVSQTSPDGRGVVGIQTDATEVRLLSFRAGNDVELEFLQDSEMLLFFPDGIFADVEWKN